MQEARSLFPAYAGVSMHQRVRKLSIASAAYIAGLVDGEGTITLTRLHAGENRRIVVSVANTEIAILRFVHEEIGAGKITRKKTISVNHTPSFCFALTSRQALELLRQIVHHLRSYKRFERKFLSLVAPRGEPA